MSAAGRAKQAERDAKSGPGPWPVWAVLAVVAACVFVFAQVPEVRKIADGRVFTGKQALAARLVDELGNLEDAIQVAAKLAGIKGDPHVISKKERFSLIDLIRGGVPKELAGAFPSLGLKFLLVP